MLSASELIGKLGGTNAAARFFGVKPPSVTAWLKNGVVTEGKLIRKAAALERVLPGQFSRRTQWPDEFAENWPELERRDPNRISPYAGTDIDRRAPAGGVR